MVEAFLMQLPLGEILKSQKLINDEQLCYALALQKQNGDRLGDILVSTGMIGYYDLYKSIATHYRLAFVNLIEQAPDSSLLKSEHIEDYVRLNMLPWRRDVQSVCIATCDPNPEVRAWAKRHFGDNCHFAITSPFDIRKSVEARFGKLLEDKSRLSLWNKAPDASARITVQPKQKRLILFLMLGMAFFAIGSPVASALGVIIFCHVAYAITMLFKAWIFAMGSKPITRPDWDRLLATLDERTLPVYTILIPMYREAETLPRMLENMRRLDYPPSKLDIKLVLEADDTETLDAAYAIKPSYHFDIIRVPPSAPRTKPKACNYALRFARGEFVTVFDADDCPEPSQLKKAVYMFRNGDPDMACLQARLNYYNFNDNWITRSFSLEYTILFHFMLYGLQRLSIPIPLGGTSNHMPLAKLRELGEWDPYNVTEDADLGTRLAAWGMKTTMLDSFTLEEAPCSFGAWIRQRSRWIKGYMQTWLVHMRNPVKLYKTLGMRGFIGFQFFIGFSSFAFLTAPIVWGLSILWMGNIAQWHAIPFPDWLAVLTLLNLALNITTHWYCALYCAMRYQTGRISIVWAAILYPVYLVLHSIASYKALWQLIVNPHFWEKTSHGFAKHVPVLGQRYGLIEP
jgi:glycosyltransferase XagB